MLYLNGGDFVAKHDIVKGLTPCEVRRDNWDNWTVIFAHKIGVAC